MWLNLDDGCGKVHPRLEPLQEMLRDADERGTTEFQATESKFHHQWLEKGLWRWCTDIFHLDIVPPDIIPGYYISPVQYFGILNQGDNVLIRRNVSGGTPSPSPFYFLIPSLPPHLYPPLPFHSPPEFQSLHSLSSPLPSFPLPPLPSHPSPPLSHDPHSMEVRGITPGLL